MNLPGIMLLVTISSQSFLYTFSGKDIPRIEYTKEEVETWYVVKTVALCTAPFHANTKTLELLYI